MEWMAGKWLHVPKIDFYFRIMHPCSACRYLPVMKWGCMMDFMSTFQHLMQGIWELYDYDMTFPNPLGVMDAGDILLFFATCYLVADTMSMVAERRD